MLCFVFCILSQLASLSQVFCIDIMISIIVTKVCSPLCASCLQWSCTYISLTSSVFLPGMWGSSGQKQACAFSLWHLKPDWQIAACNTHIQQPQAAVYLMLQQGALLPSQLATALAETLLTFCESLRRYACPMACCHVHAAMYSMLFNHMTAYISDTCLLACTLCSSNT